jgi:lipopolysaccharide export system permease protein
MAVLPRVKKRSVSSWSFIPISIMDRYLIREMVGPFLFGVGAFTSIALAIGSLFELIRLITNVGLSVITALEVFALQLPGFMVYSFPMSMLLSTLMTYGRLSGDGEITALRSCGISVYRLVLPALVLSLFVSGMTFAFHEVIVPSANFQAKNVLRRALKQTNPQFRDRDIFYQQYGEITNPDGTKEQGLVRSFYARRFDGQVMRNITVLDFSQGQIQQILSAESGVWKPEQGVWEFRNGTNYIIKPDGTYYSILRFDKQDLRLPRAPLDFAQEQRSAEEMNIRQLTEFTELTRQSGNWKEARKLEVSLQQKYALPFICVVFALVGSPLGMRPQRTTQAIGFGISVLIIFGYYLLLFVCGALGQVEILPPVLAAWLPNLLGLGAGLFLLQKANA